MMETILTMELKEVKTRESLPAPICKRSKGNPPAQVLDGLFMDIPEVKAGDLDMDGLDDFGDGEDFNEDDLDNLSINDNYFEDQM